MTEDNKTSQSRTTQVADGLFGVLVASAAALTLAALLDLSEPPASSSAPGVEVSAGLAYQRQPASFNGVRAEAIGPGAAAAITYPWGRELPDWTVEFVDGDGPVAGYTWSQERRIEVFVRPDDDEDTLRRVLAHELGHAVDVTFNSPEERDRWLAQRNADNVAWWPTSGAADFETGAGDFAEVFAAWEVGNDDFRSRVGPKPSTDDLELLEELVFG